MMKSLVFAMLMILPSISGGPPVMKTLPGWQLGTVGAQVKVDVFYDL